MSVFVASEWKADKPRTYCGSHNAISCRYKETKGMKSLKLSIFSNETEIVTLTGKTPIDIVVAILDGASKQHLEPFQRALNRHLHNANTKDGEK